MPAWCWVARAVRFWYYLHHVTWDSMSRWGKLPQNKRKWMWLDVGLKFWATWQSESKLTADYNVSVPEVTHKSEVICFLNAARWWVFKLLFFFKLYDALCKLVVVVLECKYASLFYVISFCYVLLLFMLLWLCATVICRLPKYLGFSGFGCIYVFIFRVKTTQPCCESTRHQWTQNINLLQHQ